MWRIVLALLLAVAAQPSPALDLNGRWALTVENLDHKPVAKLTLSFADKAAPSCMGGPWRQVVVHAATTADEAFFPINDRLSYLLDSTTLTLGRNEICDGYLHLSGSHKALPIRGEYYGFGISGGRTLGYFSLDRADARP